MEITLTNKVTIILDDQLMKKLRKKQSMMIKNSTKNVSFSHVIVESLEKSL